ncbi:hypothetical protein N0V93_003955 [Gnomoniopsis smithogilvyi]|uniref:Uncharacterized protein n=1 Tax=Gnomoniopsis smithogilvyi TaxID=1191159 RepID=A0A9W9CZM2_9PEZI|nr:hypothetical protein N0V93_003955 [Gnomoniopsis smithogilvyi]
MGGRAPLTHSAHPPTVASAPPPPVPREPIDFENNPDVIALQATVGILLQQKKRAEADLIKLKAAKNAAMERPLDFARDLTSGRVSQGPVKTEEDEDSDEDDEDDDNDVDMKTEEDGAEKKPSTASATNGLQPSALKAKSSKKGKGKAKAAPDAPPPWANLPQPQNIARMPPINWTQYAVEGEALNKLHKQQLTHPTLGMPAVMGPNGAYEFTGATNPDDGKKFVGISAPFDPLRDRVIEKKPKGPSRKSA